MTVMKVNERIFREYDVRGVLGKDLDKDIACWIGRAFASFVKEKNPRAKTLSVGRDIRNSSDNLASGIIEGIISTGMNVCDIGVCPTPVQYISLFHLDLDGGVMITGSHNPPEYDGFKGQGPYPYAQEGEPQGGLGTSHHLPSMGKLHGPRRGGTVQDKKDRGEPA